MRKYCCRKGKHDRVKQEEEEKEIESQRGVIFIEAKSRRSRSRDIKSIEFSGVGLAT